MTASSSQLVLLVGIRHAIELDLLRQAKDSAWLEVVRVYLQQRSLPLLQRWLNEFSSRREQLERAEARFMPVFESWLDESKSGCEQLNEPPVVQEVPRDQYRKLKSASAAVAHAFNECSAAFTEKNYSRLNHWLDERKLRSRHFAELADEWLKAYAT